MGYFGPLGIPWTCTLGDDPTIKTICRIKKTGKTYPIIPTDRWSKPEIICRLKTGGGMDQNKKKSKQMCQQMPWGHESMNHEPDWKKRSQPWDPALSSQSPHETIDIFPSMDSIGLFIPLTKWSGFYFPRVFLAFSAQLFQQHRAL